MSLRALHSAKDEEARWKSRDEARWVEVEQLVTALKDSKDEPQLKPLPALHARGARMFQVLPFVLTFRFFLLFVRYRSNAVRAVVLTPYEIVVAFVLTAH